jgi:hypothetical protein
VKSQLKAEFQMTDLGEIKHFLGMRFTRGPDDAISIDQEPYIRAVLERFGMENCKPVSTPMAATGARLVKVDGEDDDNVDEKLYQSIVGSLMYAMLCTRPDVAFAVQQLSQFLSKPTDAHLQAAKRVLRYFQGTKTNGITFKRHSGVDDVSISRIDAFCDADFAANEDRKSISGYIFILAGAAISWQAKKQTTIATSTVESEYAALSAAAREFLWLCILLKDLGQSKYAPKILYCDNQGAIALAKNPTHHAKTKHVDVQLHFIRDHIEKGDLEVLYCPTDDMIADITTKALARDRHVKLMGLMGMRQMESATPSSFKDDHPIGNKSRKDVGERTSRTGMTSGSDEFRPPRAPPGVDIATPVSEKGRSDTGASYLCNSSSDSFKAERLML